MWHSYGQYPPVDGLKCKPGVNRITAHTDESLITLLLTSSGAVCLHTALGLVVNCVNALQRQQSWEL
jgi:type III secretory pathway component EscS